MADQREHGVGGLEWRDQPARTPDEPLVPSTGAVGEPDDETIVVPPVGDVRRPGRDMGGTDRRAGEPDPDPTGDGDTRRFGVLPTPTNWSDGTEQDGPVDLSALHADDELLSALAAFDSASSPADPELKSLLQSWRLDVDAEPIGELVDTDTAMATIAVGARIHKRRPRYLVPVAAAAAVVVIAFTGMGLAARSAVPGDTLWGISQVLYSGHARSVEAAASVRSDLHHASMAIEQGQFSEARNALVRAQASLPSVDTEDGKAGLQAQQQHLLNQLENTTALTPGPPAVPGGVGVLSSSSSMAVQPPVRSSATPVDTVAPPEQTTTTQPVQPPPVTTTTQPPPPPVTTTTDSPVQQTGTVGDGPAQQPPGQSPNGPAGDAPAQQDPVSAGSAGSTSGG